MHLEVDDEGLSTDLAAFGVREPVTTREYQHEIKELAAESSDTLTVIDIGANIGYYAFMPVALLDDAEVIAIEVDEENVQRLQRNIELNGYERDISVVQSAVGEGSKTANLYRSTHSNRHTLQPGIKDIPEDIVTSAVEADVRSLDDVINEEGIEFDDIDVLRMDVEGYEANVFRGMTNILDETDELLIQIEIHPDLLGDENMDYICDVLNDENVEIISAARQRKSFDIESVEEIRDWRYMELVMYYRPSDDV
jgi:FkbM family methyltransferase